MPASRLATASAVRAYGKAAQAVKVSPDAASRYDWSKVPIERARMVAEETLRLAQRDGIVIDND